MAIDVNNARFLLALKKSGLDYSEVATVGRQGLFIPPPLVKELFETFGVTPAVNDPAFYSKELEEYSEPFFHEIGASKITTIDYSDYENASVIQDMNQVLDEKLKDRFSLVIDAGSIEHMFNFPQAIKNYMDMVKVGGHLVLVNMPVNNHMGHGFYQFSPELFYNLFNADNGFEMLKVVMAEDFPFSDFYEVTDPKQAQERICLCNDQPVLLFMVARKKSAVDKLKFPIQNDYVQSWSTTAGKSRQQPSQKGPKQLLQSLYKGFSQKEYFRFTVKRNWNIKKKKYSLLNESFFKKVKIESEKIKINS